MTLKFSSVMTALAATLVIPHMAMASDTVVKSMFDYETRALIDYNERIQPLISEFSEDRAGSKSTSKMSNEYLASMQRPKSTQSLECMAEALYFEARGETLMGQFAVAEVIKNRVSSSRFPDSVCGVINQGTGRKFACQFTYTCDGRPETIGNKKVYEKLRKISALVLREEVEDITHGATYYHTKAVNPRWARVFTRTRSIGAHYFYRQS